MIRVKSAMSLNVIAASSRVGLLAVVSGEVGNRPPPNSNNRQRTTNAATTTVILVLGAGVTPAQEVRNRGRVARSIKYCVGAGGFERRIHEFAIVAT